MSRALLILALALPLAAERVRVTWPANPEPDVDAYVVVATAAPPLVETLTAPPTDGTEAWIDSLTPGRSYLVSVTAFNTAGLASDPSDAAAYTVPVDAVPVAIEASDDLETWHAATITLPPGLAADGRAPAKLFIRRIHP